MTREPRPSLRDVSVAPGARLRRQCAHMGFTDRRSGGWSTAGCLTTSWRMGTSVSALPKLRLETKAPPCVECVSLVRCPLSSSARSRDAKVSRHHRSSTDRGLCALRRKRCCEGRSRSGRIILLGTQRQINMSGIKSGVIKSSKMRVILKINVNDP